MPNFIGYQVTSSYQGFNTSFFLGGGFSGFCCFATLWGNLERPLVLTQFPQIKDREETNRKWQDHRRMWVSELDQMHYPGEHGQPVRRRVHDAAVGPAMPAPGARDGPRARPGGKRRGALARMWFTYICERRGRRLAARWRAPSHRQLQVHVGVEPARHASLNHASRCSQVDEGASSRRAKFWIAGDDVWPEDSDTIQPTRRMNESWLHNLNVALRLFGFLAINFGTMMNLTENKIMIHRIMGRD